MYSLCVNRTDSLVTGSVLQLKPIENLMYRHVVHMFHLPIAASLAPDMGYLELESGSRGSTRIRQHLPRRLSQLLHLCGPSQTGIDIIHITTSSTPDTHTTTDL